MRSGTLLGAASSLLIVQVALPSEMTAFTGLESSSRKLSLGSSVVSPLIGTETVRVVVPGAKVTVPPTAV